MKDLPAPLRGGVCSIGKGLGGGAKIGLIYFKISLIYFELGLIYF